MTPTQLRPDSGIYYRDKNAARYPKHPIEPAVVASLDACPTLPLDLDIFTCRSTLSRLLNFVMEEEAEFRMLAYKVGRTIFLIRRENSPMELIPDVRGFGHTFPEANTTWETDVKGSASHQRIIRYAFGGLRLAVRFEADGYMKSSGLSPPSSLSSSSAPPSPPFSVDGLVNTFSTANMTTGYGRYSNRNSHNSDGNGKTTTATTTTTTTTTAAATATPKLKVTRAGPDSPIPHSVLFELKTRSIRKRDADGGGGGDALVAAELPRLWLTQLRTLVMAYHARGSFDPHDTEVHDLRPLLRRWESDHRRGGLARLAALLRRLPGLVAEAVAAGRRGDGGGGDGVVEICRRQKQSVGGGNPQEREEKEEKEEDLLEIREPGAEITAVLSDEVLKRWVSAVSNKGGDDKESEIGVVNTSWDSDSNGVSGEVGDNLWDDIYDDYDIDAYKDDYHFGSYGEEEEEALDFTACSADDCGYCGRCPY